MRKMVMLIVTLTIFSFGVVYAQEAYSTDTDKIYLEMIEIRQEETKKIEKELGKRVKEKNIQEETVKNEQDIGKEKNEEVKQDVDVQQNTKTDSKNNQQTNVKPTQKSEEKKMAGENNKKEVQKTNTSNGNPVIDTNNANNGSFKAKYLNNNKLKIMVIKDGNNDTYDLKGDNSYQSYPLQHGDGVYKISIMENIGGKEYKYILTKEVEVKTVNPNAKYLTSVQMVNWNNSMAATKKAKSLTSGLNDEQKVGKIYNFVVNNIQYNTSITKLPSGYVPNINTIYNNKKGICYDFASIFAGMLRSVGVPTKLIKGQSTNVEGYHAWNEVYVGGSWKIVDTSYDSQLKAAGHKVSRYKSGGQYTRQKQY